VKNNIREQYKRRLKLMTILDSSLRAKTEEELEEEQERLERRRE
jgi:hypothetical protein